MEVSSIFVLIPMISSVMEFRKENQGVRLNGRRLWRLEHPKESIYCDRKINKERSSIEILLDDVSVKIEYQRRE